MPADWHRRILSLVQPLAAAMATRRLSRAALLEWAAVLEGVAGEMRERASD